MGWEGDYPSYRGGALCVSLCLYLSFGPSLGNEVESRIRGSEMMKLLRLCVTLKILKMVVASMLRLKICRSMRGGGRESLCLPL